MLDRARAVSGEAGECCKPEVRGPLSRDVADSFGGRERFLPVSPSGFRWPDENVKQQERPMRPRQQSIVADLLRHRQRAAQVSLSIRWLPKRLPARTAIDLKVRLEG